MEEWESLVRDEMVVDSALDLSEVGAIVSVSDGQERARCLSR